MFLWMPVKSYSQSGSKINSIQWVNNLSWDQIKTKAKAENKFIFVDCFATWCLPCKKMDSEVLALDTVGMVLNSRYISIKVQMDTSKNDNVITKKWYSDASKIMNEFKINAFPTFLFFDPNGVLVHRGIGVHNRDGFLSLATDALNPETQYYSLLKRYREGDTNNLNLKWLARSAKLFEENEMANDIATSFLEVIEMDDMNDIDNVKFVREFRHLSESQKRLRDYVENIVDIDRLNELNISLMADHMNGTNGKTFQLFYNNADTINEIMKTDGYAQRVIDNLITQQEVKPILDQYNFYSLTPNWDSIRFLISKRYNDKYANRITSSSKVSWYLKRQDWSDYTRSLVEYFDTYGNKDNPIMNNNSAWAIFERSKNKGELLAALRWIEELLNNKRFSNWGPALDTYANLLYKLGRTKEAIKWQELAVKYSPLDTDNMMRLQKMKKGEPTWISSK
ncbi:thioredoxin fold domain-containing protein [Longitalea arenae]|uniref:thioredoxin fold domain-containing protein n=1 Tax=Longitalea arenae TaxID=2812558 RepID=UPI001968658C|nr:thioredoxin fold domain-containing protein [Longitalea arenae]